MNNRSGFSVIIPTLHEEKSIGQTLSSIQDAAINSSHDIEMIIVDGGSEDRTRQIAGKYTNNVFLYKEPGIAKARNYGAMNASGDILVFIDADTMIPKNFFNIFSKPATFTIKI